MSDWFSSGGDDVNTLGGGVMAFITIAKRTDVTTAVHALDAARSGNGGRLAEAANLGAFNYAGRREAGETARTGVFSPSGYDQLFGKR